MRSKIKTIAVAVFSVSILSVLTFMRVPPVTSLAILVFVLYLYYK